MINRRLFWQLISQHIVFLAFSFLLVLLALFIAIRNANMDIGTHDIKAIDAGVIFGFGYFLIFNFLGQRLRSLLAYEFNHQLPKFRLQAMNITAIYSLMILSPLLVCYYFYDLTFTQLLTIIFISVFVVFINLFNQTVSTLAGLGLFFMLIFERTKIKDNPDYQIFDYIPLSIDMILGLLITSIILSLVWALTKMPKQYFGISGGKTTARIRNIDPLLNRGKLTKIFRQEKLQLYYFVMNKLNRTKSNIGICFWNYKFTSLDNIRYIITFLALFFYLIEAEFVSSIVEGWNSAHKDKGGSDDSKLETIMPVFAYLFLVIFSMFDGSKLASFTNSINFLWLKKPANGIKAFINSIYYVMAKITIKEILLSYFCYLLVLASFGLEFFDLAYLTLIFMIVKVFNIALMQTLTSNIQRRWVWAIIGLANALMFIGLAVINAQETLNTHLVLSVTLFLTCAVSYTLLKYNYEQNIKIKSLGY